MHANRRRQIEDAIKANRLNEALTALTELTRDSPDDEDAIYLMGVTHYRLGDFLKAEDSMRRVIAINVRRADSFYYLGLTAERQHRHEDALNSYRTALAIAPDMQLARKKVEELDSSRERIAPSNASHKTESELVLPRTDSEFFDYESRRRKKAEIDMRAERDARIALLHEWLQTFLKLPIWVKVVTASFAGLFAFVFIYVGVQFVTFESSAREARRKLEAEAQAKQLENRGRFCEDANKLGITPPGC